MSDTLRLEALGQEKLAGRRVDAVGFIDELMMIALEAGESRRSLADDATLRLALGDKTCQVPVDTARPKLRMLCARLSELCSRTNTAEVSPYGGAGVITMAAGPPCSVS